MRKISRRLSIIFGVSSIGVVTVCAIQSAHATSPNFDVPDDIAAQIIQSFQPFSGKIKTRHDDKYFYVESDGMPDHKMMVGITAWQQQVPLPQPYVGPNAWQFPLVPKVARNPLSAKDHFFRGAIAIAANGVSIFKRVFKKNWRARQPK